MTEVIFDVLLFWVAMFGPGSGMKAIRWVATQRKEHRDA